MGKQDKLYITANEWASDFGGAKANKNPKTTNYPFTTCSLSLEEVRNPVCTRDGTVYEMTRILPFIKKNKTNPITGEPLEPSDLVTLHITRSQEESTPICPVTMKSLSHLETSECNPYVNLRTGHVFAESTLKEFCYKPKRLRDLVTDEEFQKSDIVLLKCDARASLAVKKEFQKQQLNLAAAGSVGKVLNKLETSTYIDKNYSIGDSSKKKQLRDQKDLGIERSEPQSAGYERKAHFSTNAASMSFTSSTLDINTTNEPLMYNALETMFMDMREMPAKKKREGAGKALVDILISNFGEIRLELDCARCPITCYNFVRLCQTGYYVGTKFHRNIAGFMIQGGDPTFTGKGGEAIYGEEFQDEFHKDMRHSQRGTLAMANHGANTNSSQFHITYKATPFLDNKHTVFGKVVGGLDVLDTLERVPVNAGDRPKQKIAIEKTNVVKDPFQEYKDSKAAHLAKEAHDGDEKERRREKRQKIERQEALEQIQTIGKYFNA